MITNRRPQPARWPVGERHLGPRRKLVAELLLDSNNAPYGLDLRTHTLQPDGKGQRFEPRSGLSLLTRDLGALTDLLRRVEDAVQELNT